MKYDYTTSTVDGAEGFARANSDYYDDRPTLNELLREEAEETEEGYEEECNCSDPGCPCRGVKIGGL